MIVSKIYDRKVASFIVMFMIDDNNHGYIFHLRVHAISTFTITGVKIVNSNVFVCVISPLYSTRLLQ